MGWCSAKGSYLVVKADDGGSYVMSPKGDWFQVTEAGCTCPEYARFGACPHTRLVAGEEVVKNGFTAIQQQLDTMMGERPSRKITFEGD